MLILALTLCHVTFVKGQVPQGFNYQAVARNTNGDPITNQSLPVRITIQSDSLGGTLFWQEIHSGVSTNAYGILNLSIGQGARQVPSSLGSFSEIDWTITPKFIKTEVDFNGWKNMGSARLWSVPYSMVAGDLGGPLKKLAVAGVTNDMEEPLFEVKNKNGQTVLAVYNEGVRIYVDDGDAKGIKGGFAIGGFGDAKAQSQEYFVVSPDSIRAYIGPSPAKGVKGGFAIGGLNPAKALPEEYLLITPENTRINVKEPVKGVKGGFAIGGLTETKTKVTTFTALTPQNYFIGHESGDSITTGLYNSFFGYQAGKSNKDGNYNIFIGYQSGYSNTGPPSPDHVGGQYGSFNSYIGYKTGYSSINGAHNTFIGYASGTTTSSDNNTFVGSLSGSQNTTGSNNTFIGTEAGSKNVSGTSNTILGRWAGWNLTDGSNNTLLGTYAGADLKAGHSNVIIGSGAMADIYYGSSGTASSNVIIGVNAGKKALNGSKNIFIGYQAGMEETGSGLLYIDNSASSTPLIYGNFETNDFRINGDVEYTGTIGTPSDARLKQNVVELSGVMEKLMYLRGVYFDWIPGSESGMLLSSGHQIGVIAQELELVYPELVITSENGYKMVDYTKLTPVLLQAVKEQQLAIDSQQSQIDELKSRLSAMEELLENAGNR